MNNPESTHIFAYNGAPPPHEDCVCFDYRDNRTPIEFKIPSLQAAVVHIPDRYLDLLLLAAYVFCADRYVSRGDVDSPYFSSWRRHFRHIMAVQDLEFWSSEEVKALLRSSLGFMTGDYHEFEFVRGDARQKAHMFDEERFLFSRGDDVKVMMFSGGIDSTSGALDVLANSQNKLVLASHISRPRSVERQQKVIKLLNGFFPGRLDHYSFRCHFKGTRAREETQRSRAFLYTAVGATVAHACGQDELLFYENGVMSINLPPAEQYKNARASRTTHPRVLNELSRLLTLVNEAPFRISNPFIWKTKTDIVSLLASNGGIDLLNETVSCSRTFDVSRENTHCGRCSQCIDRRFAIAAAGLLPIENRGLYAYDLVTDDICPDAEKRGLEERTLLSDYIRLAVKVRNQSVDTFADTWLDEITDIEQGFDECPETLVENLHSLFTRHGAQVEEAITQFRSHYRVELLESVTKPNSLEDVLKHQEYLYTPAQVIARRLSKVLARSTMTAFATQRPESERAVQDHLQAVVDARREEMMRESPVIHLGFGSAVPDFSKLDLIMEVKYVRDRTSPSKATESIMADCSKYPKNAYLLFFIYDPDRQIKDDEKFADTIARVRPCEVVIVH